MRPVTMPAASRSPVELQTTRGWARSITTIDPAARCAADAHDEAAENAIREFSAERRPGHVERVPDP